jgi:cell filamentation protein
LAKRKEFGYSDVLQTHKTLFDTVYPWAGQDRTPSLLTIKKGSVVFANPAEIRPSVEYGLRLGQDKDTMIERPGEVMGYLAFGHPLLDGNGRTIMTLHSVLVQRAGFSIDWSATNKVDDLNALTSELERPGKGILDGYLAPFVSKPIDYDRLAAQVVRASGLDGRIDTDEILGNSADPEVKAQYEAMLRKRNAAIRDPALSLPPSSFL